MSYNNVMIMMICNDFICTKKLTKSQLSLTHNAKVTRNSSGDEIANVNFLYDDIVHAPKMQ